MRQLFICTSIMTWEFVGMENYWKPQYAQVSPNIESKDKKLASCLYFC
jgi:hypothetical protein